MKKLAVLACVIVACQRHDDPTTSTSSVASTSATASAAASVTPLATIDPVAPVSVNTALTVNAPPLPEGGSLDDKRRAELLKQSEQMQLQILQALGTSNPKDVPHADLSSTGVGQRDGGLQFGARSGPLREGGGGPGRGGLAGIGARDH